MTQPSLISARFQAFDCGELVANYAAGRYDEHSQLQFSFALHEAELIMDETALVIGRAGADGIVFCDRQGQIICP